MNAYHRLLHASAVALLVAGQVSVSLGAESANAAVAADAIPVVNEPEIWKDASKPMEARARDLVRRLSLEEKASQVMANPPAIQRLGIPAYSHRNECLHGLTSGNATVFPQAIGMAATWDTPLIHEEADAISTEGRAKHNDYVARHNGDSGEQVGVNFYSPNINIFRDPRWGRGQETYGEDPFLTSRFGVAFIQGLQGEDGDYLKAIACAKHFAVHSGPEHIRHRMDAKPADRDLYETYLPAFEAAVKEGHVHSAMGAYSSLYGLPCCADPFLLTDLLRKQWGFDGVVFSDGGAIGDIWAEHKFVETPAQAAAAAVKAGCDVSSGGMKQTPSSGAGVAGHRNDGLKGGRAFSALPEAVQEGLITEAEVDTAVTREIVLRMRLGLFDSADKVPFAKIGLDQTNTPGHRALALKVAEESITLLKNDGVLPIDRSKVKRIAVIGPNADAARMLAGNYTGAATNPVTILQGIKAAAGDGVEVTYAKGCPLALRTDHSNEPKPEMTKEAIDSANAADMVIFVGGIDSSLEKEEGRDDFDGFVWGDRTRIELPAVQEELIKKLHATGKPVIYVNCTGSAIAMPWEAEHLPAIVQAWYPGEEGGTAVAKVLFGDANPAGRLPITFYAATKDLPDFEDYSMANRTYRYFSGKPLFAFGHGLSYTKFDYAAAKLDAEKYAADKSVKVRFTIQNTGPRDGDEVAQVYVRHIGSSVPQPRQALCAFERLHVAKGASAAVNLEIPVERFRYWDTAQKKYVVEPGKYELLIGGASDDIRQRVPVNVE